MVGSFMLGYFLNLKLPGHRMLRVIMFIPALISLSALGMLFVAVLGPTGLVNSVLDQIGLGRRADRVARRPDVGDAVADRASRSGPASGFTAILFAARLSAIDDEIYAAAELDGANHWQKMWQVAFPIVRDYFGVLTMLQYLWTLFGSAGLVLLLTRGGPGEATSTLSWLVYRFGFRPTRSATARPSAWCSSCSASSGCSSSVECSGRGTDGRDRHDRTGTGPTTGSRRRRRGPSRFTPGVIGSYALVVLYALTLVLPLYWL